MDLVQLPRARIVPLDVRQMGGQLETGPLHQRETGRHRGDLLWKLGGIVCLPAYKPL